MAAANSETSIVGYIRVSTDVQDVGSQKLGISEYCFMNKLRINRWVEFEVSSRKSMKERGIVQLLADLKAGDILIVSEISRLARSVGEIATICDSLMQKKVRLICVKENIDLQRNGKDLDIHTQVMITMFGLFAQIERSLISMRTKEGLARAKKAGVKLGNPNIRALNKHSSKGANQFAASIAPVLKAFLEQGRTQREIVEIFNASGIKARNGGEWSLMQLQRVIGRIK